MDLFRSDQFKARVLDLLDQHHAPGLAVALIHGDDIESKGFGLARIDPPASCTPNTLFDIASCSKSFTAASVGMLVEDDVAFPDIRYDALVSDLLPDDFVMPEDSFTRQVTLDDILSHRTGMGRHDFSYLGPAAAEPDDVKSITRNLRNLTVTAPVRTTFIYNNMMYSVAAHLVEAKTGLSFQQFLFEKIFSPLGMRSTYLSASNARTAGLDHLIATGYSWLKSEGRYRAIPCRDIPEAIGAGNIVTSVQDGVKWIEAILKCRDPITKSVKEGMLKLRTICSVEQEDLPPFSSPPLYAAGWDCSYYRGHAIVQHTGDEAGFGSIQFFLPDSNFGGVVYGNSAGAGIVAPVVARELIDDFLQIPVDERPDWHRIERQEAGEDKTGDDNAKKDWQQVFPHVEEASPQLRELSHYVGTYSNPGYHTINVKVNNGVLFVDATDRSEGFILTLSHVKDQLKYVAWMTDYWDGGREAHRAEFVFENDSAILFGVDFEESTDDLVWFNRVANDIETNNVDPVAR